MRDDGFFFQETRQGFYFDRLYGVEVARHIRPLIIFLLQSHTDFLQRISPTVVERYIQKVYIHDIRYTYAIFFLIPSPSDPNPNPHLHSNLIYVKESWIPL